MGLLDGDTALITGAASGIGRGMAQALAREGARLALSDINVESGQALARELDAGFVAAGRQSLPPPASCSTPPCKRSARFLGSSHCAAPKRHRVTRSYAPSPRRNGMRW